MVTLDRVRYRSKGTYAPQCLQCRRIQTPGSGRLDNGEIRQLTILLNNEPDHHFALLTPPAGARRIVFAAIDFRSQCCQVVLLFLWI